MLTVENIYLDGIPCLKGDTLSDVKVLSITQAAPDNLIYKLSSLAVQIHSNIDIPINVSVDFYDLTEIDNNYKFNKKDLLISPSSCTISKPHDHILSDYFTPYINVSPNVIKGTYIGTFIITLGAL